MDISNVHFRKLLWNCRIIVERSLLTVKYWCYLIQDILKNWYIFRVVYFTVATSICIGQFQTLLVVSQEFSLNHTHHDGGIKWKHFPRYWPSVWGIHRSPVNSAHKGQWRGALMLSLICARTTGWLNNKDAGDLRRHRAHYDVIVMHTHILAMTSSMSICLRPHTIDH